jgi:hypothetical protein
MLLLCMPPEIERRKRYNCLLTQIDLYAINILLKGFLLDMTFHHVSLVLCMSSEVSSVCWQFLLSKEWFDVQLGPGLSLRLLLRNFGIPLQNCMISQPNIQLFLLRTDCDIISSCMHSASPWAWFVNVLGFTVSGLQRLRALWVLWQWH